LKKFIIGVDVGTGSARAGVFDQDATMLASSKQVMTFFREAGSIVEQSSSEIWNAVCLCIRTSVQRAAIDPADVAGIGFDATCSLVVLGNDGVPLTVGPSEDPNRGIIVWMDHCAVSQADKMVSSSCWL
jgi:D-ribulokinase